MEFRDAFKQNPEPDNKLKGDIGQVEDEGKLIVKDSDQCSDQERKNGNQAPEGQSPRNKA